VLCRRRTETGAPIYIYIYICAHALCVTARARERCVAYRRVRGELADGGLHRVLLLRAERQVRRRAVARTGYSECSHGGTLRTTFASRPSSAPRKPTKADEIHPVGEASWQTDRAQETLSLAVQFRVGLSAAGVSECACGEQAGRGGAGRGAGRGGRRATQAHRHTYTRTRSRTHGHAHTVTQTRSRTHGHAHTYTHTRSRAVARGQVRGALHAERDVPVRRHGLRGALRDARRRRVLVAAVRRRVLPHRGQGAAIRAPFVSTRSRYPEEYPTEEKVPHCERRV
jgi:hypothetical protein